jgi:hypothetical protein
MVRIALFSGMALVRPTRSGKHRNPMFLISSSPRFPSHCISRARLVPKNLEKWAITAKISPAFTKSFSNPYENLIKDAPIKSDL